MLYVMLHLIKIIVVIIGLCNYFDDVIDDDMEVVGMPDLMNLDEVNNDSYRDSENEDPDDDDVPKLGVQNHEHSDSSGDEEEEKDTIPTHAHISIKKTVILKNVDTRLDDKHHKVTGDSCQ